MSKTKTIGEWERLQSTMLVGEVDTEQQVTFKEFAQLMLDRGHVDIHHGPREDWLRDNGYTVTRKNMMNMALPHQPRQ
jgi:hypothetical protein